MIEKILLDYLIKKRPDGGRFQAFWGGILKPHLVVAFGAELRTHHLLDGLALGQFIHEFVEVAHLLTELIFNVFEAPATDYALDERSIGVQLDGIKDLLKGPLCLNPRLDGFAAGLRKPSEHLEVVVRVNPFSLQLSQVVRMHRSQGHARNAFVGSHAARC